MTALLVGQGPLLWGEGGIPLAYAVGVLAEHQHYTDSAHTGP
ncbi:hypothetical protein [Streptomyces melanogenes]